MTLRNLKIGTQLILGFGAMIAFVITLGVVSKMQSDKIHLQTVELYNHPLQVRRAVSSIKIDILNMRLGTRELALATNQNERQTALQLIELSAADIQLQFDIINARYLGSKEDVQQAFKAFISWKTAREENTMIALAGKKEELKRNVLPNSVVGKYRDSMMSNINKIDSIAEMNSERIYAKSNSLREALNIQLLIFIIGILLLSAIVIYFILRNIRTPILELTDAAQKFHDGDLSARSHINSKNEYGKLSDSFNVMVENIQLTNELNDKTSSISQVMLLDEEPTKFFASVLPALASHTNSQMAAVYLLSEDKKLFEHFESLGMEEIARQSFAVDKLEGEFGSVISTHKIQYIKRIPKNTRFLFHTVSGKFVPREIVTIPIISGNEVIAIISLTSIRNYSEESILFINNILYTLTARIEGVLSFKKMQVFTKKVELQNIELEAQKTEMFSQSAELTEQNRELEIQKIQLNEANRLKTNFMSNMSHELRTPLNSVIALSGVLNRRLAHKIPEDEYSYLEVIERNGKLLLSLINDILDISRIEAGKEEIELSQFSSKDLISEILQMIHPQAKQKSIELLQKTEDKDIFIHSDMEKCRHIIQNLVANAVKFTERGKVEISTLQIGNNAVISVSDTGIGIAANHISHIFDEFRQADAGTSRKFGGTGLGLAIAKKYAHLLGGTISVKSNIGEGSVFILTLPLNNVPSKRTFDTVSELIEFNTIVTPIPHNTNTRKTILLVEDSEPAIIQLKDFMEESGYKILVARNGAEALEIISEVIPDAMILDLMMPDIDGFEVLRTIREAEATAHIPVLILTAKHITKEDLQFLKRNNVHQLIQKGDVNRSELLSSVSSLVYTEKIEVIKQRVLQKIIGKPVVLIIEDNKDNMITVKAILENNYTILEAEDGNKGIKMAKEHTPNLILMDIALPGMDGIEVFKLIRNIEHLAHIPVLALTANAMITDRETILAHGFDGYIAKPIEEKVFFDSIKEVLYGK